MKLVVDWDGTITLRDSIWMFMFCTVVFSSSGRLSTELIVRDSESSSTRPMKPGVGMQWVGMRWVGIGFDSYLAINHHDLRISSRCFSETFRFRSERVTSDRATPENSLLKDSTV